MAWPDIFFKAKKRPPEPVTPPPAPVEPPVAEAAPEPLPVVAPAQPQPPTIKPVPTVLGPQATMAILPPKAAAEQLGTRTLPAMHGVVLRPPTRLTSTTMPLPSPGLAGAARSTAPLKNIEQLMAEADPVSTLNQTASLAKLKPLTAEPTPKPLSPKSDPAKITAPVAPAKPEIIATRTVPVPATPAPVASSPAPIWTPPPFPSFQAAGAPVTREVKKSEPPLKAQPALTVLGPESPVRIIPSIAKTTIAVRTPVSPVLNDSPFILKPAATVPVPPPPAPTVSTPSAPASATPTPAVSATASPSPVANVIPPPPPPSLKPLSLPIGSIFRRKAKMTDLAKIVLPPKREDTQLLHPPAPATSPTVVPPAFPVAAMTARATQPLEKSVETTKLPMATLASPEPTPAPAFEAKTETVPLEKIVTEMKAPELPLPVAQPALDTPITKTEPLPAVQPPPFTEAKTESAPTEKLPEIAKEPELEKPAVPPAPVTPEKIVSDVPSDAPPVPPPFVEIKPPAPAPVPDLGIEPKVDPEAHKPEPTVESLPKVDPEAHKPEPKPAAPTPTTTDLSIPTPPPEKREFHLANGERVAGIVLSETPDAIYLDHGTLGVITVPRAQIAKRLVEIILINGDRIVGDIMAETADTLYVRHASLGMLTVPRAQRSTRVVEAILKDGDRILGEVLSETATFTVIRSATLGTITVPHDKVSMLNRKIEQIELKSLPPTAPELKDKPAS